MPRTGEIDDHYATLGVEQGADAAEVRRAYRELALRYHPDVAGVNATARVQHITIAYRVLSDPTTRAAYDLRRRTAEREARLDRPPGPAPWPEPSPRRARRRHPAPPDDGDPGFRADDLLLRCTGPLDALLARSILRRGADDLLELVLTRPEAATGGTAAIDTEVRVSCPTCGGVAERHRVWCARCEYDGSVREAITVCVPIPPLVADGTLFTIRFDPSGLAPPLRLRVRVP